MGTAVTGYPWEVLAGVGGHLGPFGDHAQYVGDTAHLSSPAGTPDQGPLLDHQPWTHAAPWPKGVYQSVQPDDVAARREVSAEIHARGTGASTRMHSTIAARQDSWHDFYTVDAGTSLQSPSVPGQIKAASAGFGTTDRSQSFARQNQHGYDSAHLHRRYATGSIPGAYMWMKPGGRPMVKSQAGPARPPIGEMSPFTGQDLQRDYGTQGAVLADPATEYTPPPEPYLAQAGPAPDPAPVAWW